MTLNHQQIGQAINDGKFAQLHSIVSVINNQTNGTATSQDTSHLVSIDCVRRLYWQKIVNGSCHYWVKCSKDDFLKQRAKRRRTTMILTSDGILVWFHAYLYRRGINGLLGDLRNMVNEQNTFMANIVLTMWKLTGTPDLDLASEYVASHGINATPDATNFAV